MTLLTMSDVKSNTRSPTFFASSIIVLPASIACVPTSAATRFTRATRDGLRAARFGAAFFARELALRTAFFTLRVAFRAPLRAAFFTELLVRGPPRRRALFRFAAPFFVARFLDALFFREPDLVRADFFLVAIRCAPRDE
ncbi:MAG TPA: hypothetical protein VIB98_06635 [Gemmatimonadaceae bacterium]